MITQDTIQTIVVLASVAWTTTNFQPLQIGLQALPKYWVLMILKKVLSCTTCLAFWMTLGVTGNLATAAMTTVLATWLQNNLSIMKL